MPYFRWHGVDLGGKKRSGLLFAASVSDLNALLHKQNIALVSYTIKRMGRYKAIRVSYKAQLFEQLAQLLNSGLLLPDALEVVCRQLHHPHLQEMIQQVAHQIKKGTAFHMACAQFPQLFDVVTVHTIQVGQESGQLSQTLYDLADHLQAMQRFHKKIRSAVAMPLITFAFFIVVALVLFVGIIPRFETIFNSTGQPLPYLTRLALQISNFFRSWHVLYIGISITIAFILLKLYARTDSGKTLYDHLVLKIPFIGMLKKRAAALRIFRSVALLLQGGMQLVSALTISHGLLKNKQLELWFDDIIQAVQSGASLSNALARYQGRWFDQDAIAIISVGEESGSLSTMLERVSHIYEESINRILATMSILIQPLLMIILGLLIALLVFAIYIPIFNMATVV